MKSGCITKTYPRACGHTHAYRHARLHTHRNTHTQEHTHKRAAAITEKRQPDADDEQQQKGHSYTVIQVHIHTSAAKITDIAVPR